jgi:hypothetical protein
VTAEGGFESPRQIGKVSDKQAFEGCQEKPIGESGVLVTADYAVEEAEP